MSMLKHKMAENRRSMSNPCPLQRSPTRDDATTEAVRRTMRQPSMLLLSDCGGW
jgi:hypothetical protein